MMEMGVEERRIALERTLERDACMVILNFGLDRYLPALSFECSSLVDDQSIQNCNAFILTLASPKPRVVVCSQNMSI